MNELLRPYCTQFDRPNNAGYVEVVGDTIDVLLFWQFKLQFNAVLYYI